LLPSDNSKQQADDPVNQDLIRACEDGQRKARLAFLLSKGADIEYRSHMNCTPLHHVAYSGSAEAVEFLIDAGADINAYDKMWGVPLGFAIVNRRMDIVKLLLEHKANVNTVEVSDRLRMPLALRRIWGFLDCSSTTVLVSRMFDSLALPFGR
jgi:ankyrin repeat protein